MIATIRTIRNGVTFDRPANLQDGMLSRGSSQTCTISQLLLYLVRPGQCFHDAAYVIDPQGNIVAEARRDENGNRTYVGH